jgi:hypothetical protein
MNIRKLGYRVRERLYTDVGPNLPPGRRYAPPIPASRSPLRFSGPEQGLFRFRRAGGAKREPEARRVDLFRTLAAEGGRSLQAALLATKSLGLASACERDYRMTDLIKALRERREELRNELQEHPSFDEYELVCRLLERREASVSLPSSLRPKAPQRKPTSQRKRALQQQPVDPPVVSL